jgi:UDP-N-acetylglucosamine 2-epimerase (non-hydrolysing)
MLIHLVCGARPNFMKVAPLYHALKKTSWATPIIVHTGQHYDVNMSEAFFTDLGLPQPDMFLQVGSGSHAEQTAKVMVAYERILLQTPPDVVVVVGDVNSTMAATLAATKLGIKVAHLEAGLRSFDRRMPEELWVPSRDGVDNLIREGVAPEKIKLVGNIMIDSLEMLRDRIEKENTPQALNLAPRSYGIVTLHRPSNVDDPAALARVCGILTDISELLPLMFPVHPRTRKNMEEAGLLASLERSRRILLPEPMNYIRFMSLVMNCAIVITDSGGIQEETTHLGIPCLTVRENTERPITVTHGTNQLCRLDDLFTSVKAVLNAPAHKRRAIELWDGKTAERIVAHLRGSLVSAA